jgi:hypothetical protein
MKVRRIFMPQAQTNLNQAQRAKVPLLMTLDEKLDTIVKTVELEKQRKLEEAKQLHNPRQKWNMDLTSFLVKQVI